MNELTILEQLKKINPLKLDEYLVDYFLLTYEEGIELTHYYVRKLINRILIDNTIKNRWLILNDKYRDAFLSSTRIHIFRTFTGSGKTVTSVMWVKFLTQLSSKIEGFVVLSSEYEHGTDEIEKIIVKHGNQVDYIRFEGKSRLCTQLYTKINKNGTTIRTLMKNGISIKKYCENKCPEYKTCIYIGNCQRIIKPIEQGGIKNWIGVQHQIGHFLPIFMYHVGDIIVVIDESFSDAIKEHHIYSKPLLTKNLEFLNKVIKDLKPNVDENYRYFVEQFKMLLETFIRSLFKHLTELNYDKIGDILDNIDDSKGIDNQYIGKLNEQAFDYIKTGKMSPFKFIFGEICNFIDNYEELLSSNFENIEEWMRASFYKKQNKFEISFLYYDKCKLSALFNRDNLSKLIINDATANKLELSYLIGDKEPVIEHNEDWMYENCEFHQLKKPIHHYKDILTNKLDSSRKYAHYVKSSMLYKNTFFHLINDLKAILERHKNEKVLVVAREIGEKKKDIKILEYINGGIKLSDYIYTLGYNNVLFEDYPLSATNIYSDVNIVVLLGKPDLPNAVIKRQSALIGIEPRIYRDDIYSRRNMIQAIGRVLRGNNHKYVYILSGFDLKLNRPVKTYKSHTDLRNSLLSEIKIIEKKKEEKNEIDTLLKHIKRSKFITIKECEKLFTISEYKAKKLLENFENKKILTKGKLQTNQKGRTKIIYYANLD